MPHVALDRLFGEEEHLADLAVHEALRNQLKDFDLPGSRLLLQLLERRLERDDLGAAIRPASRSLIEAAGVIDVARQNRFALSSIHVELAIGARVQAL